MLELLKDHWLTVVGVFVGVYDVIVRLIPTVGNYSLLHKVITYLQAISQYFNREK